MTSLPIDLGNLDRAVARLAAVHDELAERIHCQLRYAAHLCALHPERSPAWAPLIAEARAVAEAAPLAAGGLEAVVARIEAILAPLGAAAKAHRILGIGHAHIDMNWMWSWPETVGVVVDTFGTVLRLMEEFPEFRFTQSQAEIYRIVEEHAPELLERIAVQVRAGRWEVAASHWVEGDKNLAGGESLCRQVLYAKRLMQRLFGLAAADLPIDWAPDTFGHAATVPTYLAQAGISACFLHRPGAHAQKWPQAFRWFGPDGAMTLVFNGMKGGYNGIFCPRMILDRVASWDLETGLSFAPYIYGVGDHGGGPTRRDLLRFRQLQTWPIFPTLELASARTFFTALQGAQARLPEVRGELNFAFAGCYTSQSLLKRANRVGENRLDDGERAAACASAGLGSPYPAGRLEAAWRPILFSQFHDILPGSCVHDSRTYSHGLFQQSMATVGQIETGALRALAATIATDAHRLPALPAPPARALHSGFAGGAGAGTAEGGLTQADASDAADDREFVLFHLDQGRRREVVEAVVWENCRDYGNLPVHRQDFAVLAGTDAAVPAQVLERGTAWGHDFVRLAFPADLPAFGYRHLTVRAGAAPAPAAGAWQLGRDDFPASYSFHDLAQEGLENDLLRLELDPRNGGIRRLLDRRSGLELIAPGQATGLLEFGCERPHGMSAWALDHAGGLQAPLCTGLRRVCNGPHVAALELRFTVASSEIVLVYELRRDDPRLHLHLRVSWREIGDARRGVPFLRLALATALTAARLRCEIPFGAIARDLHAGEEVPALQWALAEGRLGSAPAGLLLLNDGKHGHALEGGTLRLNLIRSTYEPDPLPEVGQHELRLAILPVAGTLDTAEAVRQGRCFNHPLRVVGSGCHGGVRPATGSFLVVEPADLVVLAIKSAEDGSGDLILRLNNPGASAVDARVSAGPALGRSLAGLQPADLLEAPLTGRPPVAADAQGRLTAPLPAGGLATWRVSLG